MKTQERVEIVGINYLLPSQVIRIGLIVLASFALGLIPILYTLDAAETRNTNTVPTEAGLWSVLGEKD